MSTSYPNQDEDPKERESGGDNEPEGIQDSLQELQDETQELAEEIRRQIKKIKRKLDVNLWAAFLGPYAKKFWFLPEPWLVTKRMLENGGIRISRGKNSMKLPDREFLSFKVIADIDETPDIDYIPLIDWLRSLALIWNRVLGRLYELPVLEIWGTLHIRSRTSRNDWVIECVGHPSELWQRLRELAKLHENLEATQKLIREELTKRRSFNARVDSEAVFQLAVEEAKKRLKGPRRKRKRPQNESDN